MLRKYVEKRNRRVFRLALDLNDDIERGMIEAVQPLKKQRKFATVLRNGLRLMLSLMDAEESLMEGVPPVFNAISLLEVLFPKVCGYIATRAHNAELERLNKRLVELQAQLDTMGTLEPMVKARSLSMPEPEIVVTKNANANTGSTFLSGMMALQGKK